MLLSMLQCHVLCVMEVPCGTRTTNLSRSSVLFPTGATPPCTRLACRTARRMDNSTGKPWATPVTLD